MLRRRPFARKKQKVKSTTIRSLDEARTRGWLVDKVEQWVPNPKHPVGGFRRDAFGWMDLLAVTENGMVGIQTTSMGLKKAHVMKIRENPDALEAVSRWVQAGGSARLWCWTKIKVRRGGKAQRWVLRDFDLLELVKG